MRTTTDSISFIWKSDLADQMIGDFFQAVAVSVLLYECTARMLMKRWEKKLDGNYARMLRDVLNKSRKQHQTKLRLYGRLPPISQSIQERWTRHAGYCWISKEKLLSDVFKWTPSHGRTGVGRAMKTYIHPFFEDTGCTLDDLPRAMDNRDG